MEILLFNFPEIILLHFGYFLILITTPQEMHYYPPYKSLCLVKKI